MKKILIIYTSVGLGHKVIAQNIAWHLERAGFEVKLADIGKVQKGKFESVVVGVHWFINKYLPFVWGWLYRRGHSIILPFRVFIAGFNYKLSKSYVDEFKPDLIITTQTTASAVIAYLKKKNLYHGKFVIAFSDYHLHPYWLYGEADFYLANTEQQKQEMLGLGVSAEKICVCGITLKPKQDVDRVNARKKFSIGDKQKIILIGTGSLGVGFKQQDLRDLAKLPNTKIIFACGKNRQLFEQVKNLKYANVLALGFYKPMDELYAIAAIFVGKPGGLSTAEALSWHLPLLVSYTLPGQEEENLKFLAARNLVIPRPKKLLGAVAEELSSRKFKAQLLTNPYVGEITGRSERLVSCIKQALA